MNRNSLYRTFLVGGFAAAALLFTGCSGGDNKKSHETLSTEMHTKWDLTRMGVTYQLAEQQYDVGDYEKCRETINQALALKVNFPKIYTLAAKLEIESGSLENAAQDLHRSMELGPAEPEPYYLMGVVYQRWQKPEVAADYYQQAWDRKPDEALYLLAVVEMKITMNQLDAAQKLLDDKLVYFEQSSAVRVALARIATLKGNYTAACKLYSDAAILNPDDKNVQRSYAESLFYANRFADAIPLIDEIRKQTDVSDKENLTMMLGQCFLSVRRPHDARNCFQEVLRDHPANKEAYIALAKACVQSEEYGLALSATYKVSTLDPDNLQGMIITALVQQKQKKWSAALATLEKANHVAPTDSTVLCMQGICTSQLGNKDQAVLLYQRAVDANPKDTWAAQLLNNAKPTPAEAPAVVPPTPTSQIPEIVPADPTAAAIPADGLTVTAPAQVTAVDVHDAP